jgi:sugar phosphate isomerase/epimerase
MVFGENLLENVYLLAGLVDHVEIVLFYTPTLHNFPSAGEVKALKKLGADEDVSFSVHLPAYLEIAARDRQKREESVQLAIDLIHILDELNPMHHVLHIPFTPPTLTPVPGLYFTIKHRDRFVDWKQRTEESLETIQLRVGQGNKILAENINYSPMFLECFLKPGSCEFCLDLGHLLLGRENVVEVTKQFLSVTREVHLHGVRGFQEHLSLAVLPEPQVNEWIRLFAEASFSGVVNLEVFSPADLEASMDLLSQACNALPKDGLSSFNTKRLHKK